MTPSDDIDRCKICRGQGQVLREFERRDCEVLNLVRCTVCSCEYLAPQPSPGRLAEEYRRYPITRVSSMDHPKTRFFEELLLDLGYDFTNKKVMDIGAAEGDLIFALTNRWPSVNAFAVEGNPEFRAFFHALLQLIEILSKKRTKGSAPILPPRPLKICLANLP